ncbi:MAG: alpha-L-rhamnosidase [Clostridiales bacterium]|nr:alpha-L-rhamnosidase [Clostridiales bacterium]
MQEIERDRTDIFRVMDEKATHLGKKDFRSRRFLFPKKVLWTQGEVENEQALLEEQELQISLSAKNPCIMRNAEGKKASVLLDYGVEIHGGIRIFAWEDSTGKGAKVRVRFGESVSEAMSELGGASNATNDHARRDMIIEVGMMSMNQIGESGFRFVRIDLLEDHGEISLKSVPAVLIYKDVPYRGSFSCSDALLNRIWDVGAYTVHLNMQEYIWDGIKRDRLVWVGDMHPETTTIQAVFGADDSVEKSLDFIRKETPLPGWMNGMASYTMWYAIVVYDWFLHTGNREFVEKQKDYLIGIQKMLSAHIDEYGQSTVKEGRFLDWPSEGKKEVVDAGVQAIHIWAEESLKKLFLVLEEEQAVKQCEDDIQRLRRYEADYKDSKQAAALMVINGMKDAVQVNEDLLKTGGAEGMSTFMGYYILTARAMAGDYEGCLDCIRDYWGGMLKLGATTFWEDFDIKWMENASGIDEMPEEGKVDVHKSCGAFCYKGYRHSLCHGWASGVTPWLSENVLGIQVMEPGCRKIKIEPHLGDLEWAKGTYPTPYGDIWVSHVKNGDGTVSTEMVIPEGVEVTE